MTDFLVFQVGSPVLTKKGSDDLAAHRAPDEDSYVEDVKSLYTNPVLVENVDDAEEAVVRVINTRPESSRTEGEHVAIPVAHVVSELVVEEIH